MSNTPFDSLAWSFFKIGLFGFGGGYAILPLIGHEVVNIHHWASWGEFSDMVALSQMTPGPIAVNAATYVGYTVNGFWGSSLATFMVALAPFIITLIVCISFMAMKNHPRVAGATQLLRPVVVGLVLAAVLSLMNADTFMDWKSFLIFAAALVSSIFWKAHPLAVLAASGIFGWLVY